MEAELNLGRRTMRRDRRWFQLRKWIGEWDRRIGPRTRRTGPTDRRVRLVERRQVIAGWLDQTERRKNRPDRRGTLSGPEL